MKTIAVLVILFVFILFVTWILYPTSLPARSFISKPLSADEYAGIKEVLFSFSASHVAYGVTARGEPGPQGAATLYCREVPLVVVSQAPTVTLMQVIYGAEQRAPSLAPAISHVLSKMMLLSQPEKRDAGSLGSVDRFFLKYRDGIDLDATCGS